MSKISHKDLVVDGKNWLMRNGCNVVVSEVVCACNESPDIIGFRHNQSILIEVKVSRDDFRSDKKKTFRQFPETGMGNYRYYLAPKGMLKPDEMPKNWTLLEYHNGRIYGERPHLKTSHPTWQPSDIGKEKILLQSVCRRVASRYGDLDELIRKERELSV